MSNVLSDVLAILKTLNPEGVLLQGLELAESLSAHPDPTTLLADISTAIQLAQSLKAKLSGIEPTVSNVIKAIL